MNISMFCYQLSCECEKIVKNKLFKCTCKVRNEIETKRNRTKRNQTKRNETDRNETKQNQVKRPYISFRFVRFRFVSISSSV